MVFALYRQKIFIIPLEKPADSLTSQLAPDLNNEFMTCVESEQVPRTEANCQQGPNQHYPRH